MASSRGARTLAAYLVEHGADTTTFLSARGNRVNVPNSLLPSEFGDAPLYSPYLMDVQGEDDLIQVMRIRPMPGKEGVAPQAESGPAGPSPALVGCRLTGHPAHRFFRCVGPQMSRRFT